MDKKDYLSIKDAADFLGVHSETLRRWDRSKKLTAEKVNPRGDRRYNPEILKRFKEMVRLQTDDKDEAKKKIKFILAELEEQAEESKYIFGISDSLREARDLAYFVLDDQRQSDEIQVLMNVFNFEVKDDQLKPKMSGTDDKGKVWIVPDPKDFKKADFEYLRKILPNYKHPRLRARISHVLWLLDNDHQMAGIAIMEYLNVVSWLNSKLEKDPDAPGFEILIALKNAYTLARKMKKHLVDVNKQIAGMILNFNKDSKSRFAVTRQLLDFALENKKDYGKEFWENALKVCKVMAAEQEKIGNEYFMRSFLEIGEKIEGSILGFKNKKWREMIAVSFEEEAKKHKASFVQSEFLIKAIQEYKSLGNQSKVEALEQELKESKKNMKFQTFEQSMDLRDWAEKVRTRFKALIEKENTEQLLVRLTIDTSIIPKYKEVLDQAEKLDKEFPLQSLFSHTIIDSSGNMPRKYETEKEKKHYSLIRQYKLSLSFAEILTRVLFEELVQSKKIDMEALSKYMVDHLWYGREYELKDPDSGETLLKSRKWIDVLLPGLELYLEALSLISKGNIKEARKNLILATDSLTPKIEGLIREFYETIGKVTDKIKIERGGKQVTEKKSLDELLREPYAMEIFGDDLLILMKFVLIEMGGYNLRNNISHALMFRENYLLNYMHWIFIILLRVGAYQISINLTDKKLDEAA